ncbi:MAG: tetratricopeptide repeat protein [Chloroflexi bacterium]|nr:tetratricopeptide repeat protein [Chloroflexota bacterium]
MTPHLQRALLLYQQSRLDLAEQELRQALVTDPDDPFAHSLLALCLTEAERFGEATDEAQRAVHLAPDFAFAHYALAQVLRSRRRFEEAVVAIREAIRLDPHDADHFTALATICLERGQWREALDAANEGLEIDPEHPGCLNCRAFALVKLGQRDDAAATMEGALASDPQSAVTHANQGWALLHQSDHRRALEHFREALRLDPELDWAREGIVEALKARNVVYGLMLRYFLWMGSLRPQTQWLVIFGGWAAYQVLSRLNRAYPALSPFILPFLVAYGLFALMSWIADPLFNLLLRLDRFGRLVLSREQVIASNVLGATLGIAILSFVSWLITGSGPAFYGAVLFLGLAIPVSATFQCELGWPRYVMALVTALIALMGVVGLLLSPTGRSVIPYDLDLRGDGGLLFSVALLTLFLSTWVGNFLTAVRVKR